MSVLEDFDAAKKQIADHYASLTGDLLTWSLIGLALVLVIVALFVKSVTVKAAVLAWVTLP